MSTHPALLDVIAQLEAITSPRHSPPPIIPLDSDLVPARRSHAEIVPIPEEDRIAIQPGEDKDTIRAAVTALIDEYLARNVVTHRLLINLPPGVGKSYQGVRAAHKAQMQGLKVAFIMPRHKHFDTLIQMSDDQGYGAAYWHQWQPRQGEGVGDGKQETCIHTEQITQWIRKGHKGAKFCGGVCGFRYMQNECIYLGQEGTIKLRSGGGITPIVAIQHQHLTSGHTMMKDFDLVIGDESPLGTYPWIWYIPTKSLIDTTKNDLPVTHFMAALESAAQTMAHDIQIDGPALLDILGGPDRVLTAIRATRFPDDDLRIGQVVTVDDAPYNYLIDFCSVLIHEAREAQSGADYIRRLIVKPDGLHMLLKRETTQDLPPKVIWLDGTASPELYASVTRWNIESFTRPARLEGPIAQITEGVFTKGSMVSNKKPSPAARQTARIIDHIIARERYTDPLIVSYQDLAPLFQDRYKFTYFHGNRGTNEFEHCDAVFILGTPQPPISQIELIGRMFYPERLNPFNATWCKKAVAYAGHDRGYMASGLWAEPDLAIILDQLREQEIVQSAHRVRPILSPKPIWLFTALPAEALPPTYLYSLLDAIRVDMDGIDASTFLDALDIAETMIADHGHCTSQQMAELLDTSIQTAYKYLAALAQYDPELYAPMEVRIIGRGRPRRAIGRIV